MRSSRAEGDEDEDGMRGRAEASTTDGGRCQEGKMAGGAISLAAAAAAATESVASAAPICVAHVPGRFARVAFPTATPRKKNPGIPSPKARARRIAGMSGPVGVGAGREAGLCVCARARDKYQQAPVVPVSATRADKGGPPASMVETRLTWGKTLGTCKIWIWIWIVLYGLWI